MLEIMASVIRGDEVFKRHLEGRRVNYEELVLLVGDVLRQNSYKGK